MSGWTVTQLTEDLEAFSAIQAGEILIVHSSLRSIGQVEGGPAAVIVALLEAIGPSGTLLMPTFSNPQPDGLFYLASTPSRTGLISETFRTWPQVRRSCPPHPFGGDCYGPRAAEFTADHREDRALGPEQPLPPGRPGRGQGVADRLRPDACSLIHVAEAIVRVPYLGKVCYAGYGGVLLTLVQGDGSRQIFPPRDAPGDSSRFDVVGERLGRREG